MFLPLKPSGSVLSSHLKIHSSAQNKLHFCQVCLLSGSLDFWKSGRQSPEEKLKTEGGKLDVFNKTRSIGLCVESELKQAWLHCSDANT